jgi:hypothetical protein
VIIAINHNLGENGMGDLSKRLRPGNKLVKTNIGTIIIVNQIPDQNGLYAIEF